MTTAATIPPLPSPHARFSNLLRDNNVNIDMSFLQGTSHLSRVFTALAGSKGYIDAEDLVLVLANYSKDDGSGDDEHEQHLKDLATRIVSDMDESRDGKISKHEFMKMPRLRTGEAPALLMQAINNMRTGNAAGEVLRSARLELYWSKVKQKACMRAPRTPRLLLAPIMRVACAHRPLRAQHARPAPFAPSPKRLRLHGLTCAASIGSDGQTSF